MGRFAWFFQGVNYLDCTMPQYYGILALIPKLSAYSRGERGDATDEMADGLAKRVAIASMIDS